LRHFTPPIRNLHPSTTQDNKQGGDPGLRHAYTRPEKQN
jgi:hypothetical protein